MISDLVAAEFVAAAHDAQAKERVEDLTDMERVGLAIAAGCEVVLEPEGNGVAMVRTKNLVGYAKVDGQWHVAEQRPCEAYTGGSLRVRMPA